MEYFPNVAIIIIICLLFYIVLKSNKETMLPLYQLQASNNFLYKYNKKSEIPWRRKFLDKVSGRRDGKISENCFCAVAERI